MEPGTGCDGQLYHLWMQGGVWAILEAFYRVHFTLEIASLSFWSLEGVLSMKRFTTVKFTKLSLSKNTKSLQQAKRFTIFSRAGVLTLLPSLNFSCFVAGLLRTRHFSWRSLPRKYNLLHCLDSCCSVWLQCNHTCIPNWRHLSLTKVVYYIPRQSHENRFARP